MFCSICGTEVEDHARYCWKCGAPITQAPRRGKVNACPPGGDDDADIRGGKAAAGLPDGDDGARATDMQSRAIETVKVSPETARARAGGANITIDRDGTIHVESKIESKTAGVEDDAVCETHPPLSPKVVSAPEVEAERNAVPAETAAETAPASEPEAEADRDTVPAEMAPEAASVSEPVREPPTPADAASEVGPASEYKREPSTSAVSTSADSIGGLALKEYGKVAVLGLLAFVVLVAVCAAAFSVFSNQNDGDTSLASNSAAGKKDTAQSQIPSSEAYTYPVVGSGMDNEVLRPTFYDGTFGEVLERLEEHGFDLSFVAGDSEKPETATVFFKGHPDWGFETDGNPVTIVVETYAPAGYTPDEVGAIKDLSVIDDDAEILSIGIMYSGPVGMSVYQATLSAWNLMNADDAHLYVDWAYASDEEMAEAIEDALGVAEEDIDVFGSVELDLYGAGFEILGEPWTWWTMAMEYDHGDGPYPSVHISLYPEDYFEDYPE